MTISVREYIGMMRHKSYQDLITERDHLVQLLRHFETKEKAGDRSGVEWILWPQPDVQYQLTFDYLAALCRLMHERYDQEYVREARTLKQDVEAAAGNLYQ